MTNKMIEEIEINNYEDLVVHKDILAAKDGLPHVGGYIRTATIDAVGNSAPETQRQMIRDFCERRFPEGCRLFWTSDLGMSGNLPWKRDDLAPGQYRSGLTILVDLVKQGSVRNVCVSRIDRLARSMTLILGFTEECIKPLGISFYSIAEMADGSRDLLTALVALEQHKRRSLQDIATAVIHARIRDGHIVGRPPYGWTSEDAGKLEHFQRIGIEPVAAEAAIVRRIVGECLEGRTPSRIAKGLASNNVQSPGGAHRWSSRAVRSVLRCPVHFGLVRSVDGTLARGAHYDKRLFDESVYDQVTEKLSRKG